MGERWDEEGLERKREDGRAEKAKGMGSSKGEAQIKV